MVAVDCQIPIVDKKAIDIVAMESENSIGPAVPLPIVVAVTIRIVQMKILVNLMLVTILNTYRLSSIPIINNKR